MPETVSSKILRVYLLRHGEPEFPDPRPRLYGWTDYPLSPEGEGQAGRAGKALARVSLGRIVTSDLVRARRTAEIVAACRQGAPAVEPFSALREVCMGEWEGLTKEEARQRDPERFLARGRDIAGVAPPAGESLADVRKRAARVFEEIAADHVGGLLVVAHRAVLWAIFSHLFALPLEDFFRYEMDYCGMHVLERAEGRGTRLLRWNWTPSLGANDVDISH